MKANTQRNIIKKKNVYNNIYEELNYNELVTNAMAVPKEYSPKLPTVTRSLIVTTKVDCIIGEKELLFFLDVTSIQSLNQTDTQSAYVPITVPLLNRYGVTPQQFIEDFKHNEIVAIIVE